MFVLLFLLLKAYNNNNNNNNWVFLEMESLMTLHHWIQKRFLNTAFHFHYPFSKKEKKMCMRMYSAKTDPKGWNYSKSWADASEALSAIQIPRFLSIPFLLVL